MQAFGAGEKKRLPITEYLHESSPPSGFVAGIYARIDNTWGVYKAPANEMVHGLNRFEININHGCNEVINPAGINALCFFCNGYRIWGARTMSSDPE